MGERSAYRDAGVYLPRSSNLRKEGSPTLSFAASTASLQLQTFDMDRPKSPARKPPRIDGLSLSNCHEKYGGNTEEETPLCSPAQARFSTSGMSAYDLAAPPPTISHSNAEYLAERLFSAEHLHLILKTSAYFHHFRSFLNSYQPQSVPTLVQYLESQKALTAIRYANSLAEQISQLACRPTSSEAAAVDIRFEKLSQRAFEKLVSDALPAYITYRLVSVVTDCLVGEITGTGSAMMQGLVQGLAEVYCLSDPSLPDNPIVFASEGFYNTTQYGQDYVIGKNCRFLQGPKTQKHAVKRISEAISKGQEISEILLNYRRDGSPFLNLVMTAPLMDHRGAARYFIGCQIDITQLMEGGRVLDSFEQLLNDHDMDTKPMCEPHTRQPPLEVLKELSILLNDEELEMVKHHNPIRGSSIETNGSTNTRAVRSPIPRILVGMDSTFNSAYLPSPRQLGRSGRLPGVYQNYILVRPFPSLRIIFTSESLRIPGLSQSRLMDRIGGPLHVRESLLDAFAAGAGVTAKISWLTRPMNRSPSHTQLNARYHASSEASDCVSDPEIIEGKRRWIHCTPLLGSDSKPHVIMIVMVNKEVAGAVGGVGPVSQAMRMRSMENMRDAWSQRAAAGVSASGKKLSSASNLYADYLRSQGQTVSSPSIDGSGRSVVDE